jgi:hypothetical protein
MCRGDVGHGFSVPGLETASDGNSGRGLRPRLPDRSTLGQNALDRGALDLGALDLGALDLGALDLGALDLGALDLGAVRGRQTSPDPFDGAFFRDCGFAHGGRKGLILAAFCLLAGCVDNNVAVQAPPPPQPQSTNMARRAGVSPSGATVAVVSFAGGPDGLRESFSRDFASAAHDQDIVMAEVAHANYLVRGYLNAVPEGEGTALTYVFNVFDAKKHQTQRIEDQILLKGHAADPWSAVDADALTALATKSSAALAAVLTNTPEAILAAAAAPSKNGVAAPNAASAKNDEPGLNAVPASNAEASADAGAAGQTVVAATPPVVTSAGVTSAVVPSAAAESDNNLRRVALH